MHPIKFKLESGGLFEDLPRNGSTAILADPRNDENLMIAGLHASFLLFHDKAIDLFVLRQRLRTNGLGVSYWRTPFVLSLSNKAALFSNLPVLRSRF